MNLAHDYHLFTEEDHIEPGTAGLETHRGAWRGLLIASIIALIAMIAVMTLRGY